MDTFINKAKFGGGVDIWTENEIQAYPGQVLGHRKNGSPIYAIAGGAADNFDDWLPEETDSAVIMRVNQVSAVMSQGRHTPMTTATKKVPRSSGMDVTTLNKSGSYVSSDDENDDVLLTARKHTGLLTVAEEDLNDSAADIIETKKIDFATSLGKYIDNATIATTAAENAPTVPYNSVLFALTQSNATTDYTANDNIIGTAVVGEASYDELSAVFGVYEDGDYFDEANTIVIAHPTFRKQLRQVKDDQGMPIFVKGQGGDSGTPDMLFETPIFWSNGLRTSATATQSPTGDPLLVVCNKDFLVLGDRSTVETQPIPAAISTSDDANIKTRIRLGFAIGHEKAFGVLRDDGSALNS